MDFIIECIQLALIIGIGVAFFNMSAMADQSEKHENIHANITDVILRMKAQMEHLRLRQITLEENFDNLEERLSVIDPKYKGED